MIQSPLYTNISNYKGNEIYNSWKDIKNNDSNCETCHWGNPRYGAIIAGAIVAGVIALWGAIVVGAIVTPYGAFVIGAIIAGTFIVGAIIAGGIVAGVFIVGAFILGALIAGAIVAGVNFAGAFVEEHLSRSNCRLQRSNSRWSICRITPGIASKELRLGLLQQQESVTVASGLI